MKVVFLVSDRNGVVVWRYCIRDTPVRPHIILSPKDEVWIEELGTVPVGETCSPP